jgi:hypothetical protein
MAMSQGIPRGAASAINDLLDNVAQIEPGQEVLLVAYLDGLHGGDNLVDETAITWLQSAIAQRGANASVLWLDEKDVPHGWQVSPVLLAAMAGCDLLINHAFNVVTEEIRPFTDRIVELGIKYVRNFATTSALLNTAWAQTPSELVAEIRYQALAPFEEGLNWEVTDPNGTHLTGKVASPNSSRQKKFAARRGDGFFFPYFPWPEWVCTPIPLKQANGVLVFDRTLSWWSRYIGISPYLEEPVELSVENSRVVEIAGGEEAKALERFLCFMKEKIGDLAYDFNTMHTGVHPQATVAQHQCPNLYYRRAIEHTHTSNLHFHIGAMHSKYKDNPNIHTGCT